MSRRLLGGLVGGVVLAGAAWFGFAGTAPPALTLLASDALVLGFAGLAAVLGLLAIPNVTAAERADVPSPTAPPPSDRPPLAETVDAAIERPALAETAAERSVRLRRRRRARDRIRTATVGVLVSRTGLSRETAAERVREGVWTDDPRAGAFLSSSVDLPLWTRLVDWFHGARYRRGLEATVDEIDRLESGAGRTDRGPGGERR